MKSTIVCSGKIIDLSKPLVMGILNVTPDSFFDGGRYTNPTSQIERCRQMIEDGASIIDIGAYSSRPGSEAVSTEEEKKRLLPVITRIKKEFPDVLLSVDTFRSEIAMMVVEKLGVDIINDISGGNLDKNMFKTIARLNVPYVLMHMQGTPENMQEKPDYKNVLKEVIYNLAEKNNQLRQLGVNDVIIDPGFGFGKTIEHNYTLLKNLDAFKMLELPVLVGVSRKSMIYKVLETIPEKALNGTTVINTIALQKGASILRVHDVKEAVEVVRLVSYTRTAGYEKHGNITTIF